MRLWGSERADGYRDRRHAGEVLGDEVAARLDPAADDPGPVVLGLARGGVPVAAQVAQAVHGRLDVLTVRKIGAPGHRELAIGAVASGGRRVLNAELIAHLRVGDRELEAATTRALDELAVQEARYRGDRPVLALAGEIVVLVDDGLATGASMRAAVEAVGGAGAARVVVAVPVGPPDSCAELAATVDDLVCPLQPRRFSAVGQWYGDFSAISDGEVLALLA